MYFQEGKEGKEGKKGKDEKKKKKYLGNIKYKVYIKKNIFKRFYLTVLIREAAKCLF